MNKVLIVCDNTRSLFFNYNKYNYVVGYKKDLIKLNIPNQRKIILPIDFISGRNNRLCDHLSAILTEKTYKLYYSISFKKFFFKLFQSTTSKNLLKQDLCLQLVNVYKSILLVKKIKKKLQLNNAEYLVKSDIININIYNKIYREYSNFPKVRVSFVFSIKFYYLRFLKKIYSLFALLVLPELIIFKNLINYFIYSKPKVHNYENCFILSENQQLNNEDISQYNLAKNINPNLDKTIFLIDKSINTSWLKNFFNNKNNIIYFDSKYNKKALPINKIIKIYFYNFNNRINIILNIFSIFKHGLFLFKNIYRVNDIKIVIENYQFNNIFRSMHPGPLIDNIIYQEYSIKSYFIYYSNHGQILGRKIKKNKSEYFQYAYLDFYGLISSKYSIDWFAYQQCNFQKKINFGIFNSNQILNFKLNKDIVFKKFKFNYQDKFISFFDNSIGNNGMISLKSYQLFLNSILLMLNNKKFKIIFKSKKNLNFLINLENQEITDTLMKIINSKMVLYANNIKMSVEEAISISELAISLPYSSVNYESFAANVKTLILDYDKRYNQKHIYFNKSKIPVINQFKGFENKTFQILNMDKNIFSSNKELYFNKIFDIENSISIKNLNNII